LTPQERNSGFIIAEEITVLGMYIGPDQEQHNADKIVEKLMKVARYWNRYNLSLPGRVAIAKTMLYSQINYLGCFLKMREENLKRMEGIIENYVRGNLNISKTRIFEKVENGGLGLFDLSTFLDSQKCSWIRRAENRDEGWKCRLFLSGYNNRLLANPTMIASDVYPVTNTIAISFEKFRNAFYSINENFRSALIFNCDLFTFRLNSNRYLNKEFFGDLWNNYRTEIVNLTMRNIHNGVRYVTLDQFLNETGIPITEEMLTGLRGLFDTAKTRFCKKNIHEKTCEKLEDYVKKIKKGSKKFRKILEINNPCEISRNIQKFSDTVDIVATVEVSKILNLSWNFGYLDNAFRTFIFKLHNNTLGLNHSLSKFVRGKEPYCTFCNLTLNPYPENETVLHFFYDCPTTENFLRQFFGIIFGNEVEIRRSDYFGVYDDRNASNVKLLLLFSLYAKKYLWDCRTRKSLPNHLQAIENLRGSVFAWAKISGTVRSCIAGCGLRYIQQNIRF